LDKFIKNHPEIGGPFDKNTKFYDYFVEINYSSYTNSLDAQFDPNISVADVNVSITSFNNLDDKDISNTKANEIVRYYLPKFSSSDFADSNLLDLYKLSKGIDAAGNTVYPGWTYACAQSSSDVTKDNGMFEGGSNSLTNCDVMVGGIVSSYNPPIRDTKGKILTEGTVTVSGGGNSFGLWKRDFYYENEKSQASGYITKSDIAEVHIGGNGYNSTAQNNKLDIQYNMILGESIGTDDDSSVLFEEAKRNYIANNPVPNFIVDSESTDDEILATYNVEWAPETLSVETESGAIITFERTSTIQYSHAPSTSQQLSIWLYENLGYLVNLTNSDYLSKIRETLAQDKESILQITYVYVVSQGSLKTVIINPYEAVWEDEETGIKYTGYNPYTGEVNLNNVKIIQKIAGSELALGIPETDDMTFTAKFCNCKNVETNHECTSYLHFDSDGNIVDEGTEDTVDYLLDTVYWNMADPWKLVPVDESSMLIDESLITHGELLWLDCGKGANLLANIPLKGKGNITYLTTSGGTDQNEAWTTMASNLKVSAGYYFVSLSTGGATAARTQYTNPDTNKTVTKYHYNGASHYSSNSDHFASMGNPKACTSNNGFKDTVVTGDKLNFLYDWKFFTSVKRYYSDNTTALDSKGHILAGGGYGHGYYKIMPLINDWTYTFGTNLDATTDVDMLIPNKGGETPIIVPAASVIDGYVFSHWELKNGPELYRNRDYEEGDVVYVSEIGQDVEFIPVYYPATDTKTITFCYNLPEHSENIQYSHGNDTCPTTDKVLNYDEYTKHIYAAWFGTLFDRFYYDETCSSDPITSAFIQVVTPNAENLSFIGYNTQADGLGVMVTDEFGVITNEDILTRDREDLVLYAQWKKAPVGDYIDIYLNPGQIGSLSNGTAFTRFIRYYRDEGIFYYEDTTSPVQYINEKGTTIKPSGSKTIVPPKSGLGTFLGWFKDDHAPGSVPKDGSKYTDMVLNCASTATNNVVLQGPVKAKQGTVDDKPRDPTTGYFGTLFQEERILEDGTIETVNTLLDREKYPSGSIVHVYAGWNIKSGLQLFLDANRKTNTTSTNGYYYYDSSVYRVTFSNQLFYGEVPKLFTATNEAGDNTPSFDLDLTYPGYKLVGWSFAYKGLGDGTQYDIEGIIEDCVFDADGNYHYITDENVNPYINTEKTIRLWDAQGRYYGTAADVLYAIYVPIEYTVNFDLYNHHGDTTIPEKESIEVFYGNTAAKADAPTNYNNFIAYFDKNCEVEDGVAVKVRKWSASSSEWASWTTITTVDTEFKVAEDWTHPASMTIKDSSNTWGGWILENYRAPKHLGLKYTISDAARRIFSFNNLNTKAVGTKYTFSIENGPAGTCYVASSNDDVASAVLDATGKKVTITANGPGLAVITIVSIVDTESSAYDSQINYFLVYRE